MTTPDPVTTPATNPDSKLVSDSAAPATSNITPVTPLPTPDAAAPVSALDTEAKIDQVRQEAASLISAIVHGLRQPMTPLRGYSDMLATPGLLGTLNEIQQQSVETIRANVIGMDGLLTDVSDYNKLTSNRLRLEPKMTTYSQIVMEVQRLIEPIVTKTGHTPIWDNTQGLPILVVDSKQLAKVMSKLINNALMYTPEGGSITIKAERLENNVLHIKVIDTGIGLTPEEIPRLGELFFRSGNEQVTSQKGYGMSLAVTTRLITLMDSKLEVESTAGKGSTFSFKLTGIG